MYQFAKKGTEKWRWDGRWMDGGWMMEQNKDEKWKEGETPRAEMRMEKRENKPKSGKYTSA